MKRVYSLAFILLLIILLMNVFSFLNINSRFISFLGTSVEQQVKLCGNYMESHLEDFESDLNRLLFEYQFSSIFKDLDELERSKRSMQVFYSKYRDLITNVYIFDNQKNYFGLYINDDDQFVIDTFPRQRQQPLTPRDKVESRDGKYFYHYPYFENDQVSGNIIVEVDFNNFAEKIFSFYPLGRTVSYHWVLNNKGEILSEDFPKDLQVSSLSTIADSIDVFASGIIKHIMGPSSGKNFKVYSAYYPLSLFNQNLGIVFTASRSNFNRYFIKQNSIESIISFILTLVLIIYLLLFINKRTKSLEKLKMSEIVFRQIIEQFPIGILILDSENIIRNINSSAQRMLFVDKKDKLIGQDFTKQFLVSNKYLLEEKIDSIDSSDYLFYEKEGIETVIFRIEETTRVGGEELRLIALIDVSTIERSRKQEVAANKAKSDFLASMSHEIRTPMNGIIGMVVSLLKSNLPDSIEEKVKIIKKSSDLLMTIINDILDLSKIEAGKMMLEEIPFLLRDEIAMALDLFKPMAEEKGLKLDLEITTSVPEKLIGDPFRLRQVISNLVSNSIKFTEKGKIVIGAEVMENIKGRMQLLFWVEDTGIGIPKDKLNNIFGSYTQVMGSVSRKFGGTGLGTAISKQLVELMNGEIWVESPSRISTSESAPGARFSFTIEVYSNEKIEKLYKFDSIQQLNQVTALFLTKEPNPERNSINKLLNQFGINVVTKIYQESILDTVLHHISIKKDLYNLLVLDDNNNLEGFALAGKLKEEGLMNMFPSILVCNNDQPGNYKISRKLGIDYYLIDPFESKELYDILSEIFSGLKDQGSIIPLLNALPKELSILLVEDNLINQKVAQSIFKSIGYEIELADNGAEAINKTREKEYDVIFMDLYMPEVDGFEATEQMRKNGVKSPIIGMSAENNDQRKADAMLTGMDEFIVKPAKLEIIKHLLIKLFSSRIK